MPQVTISKQEYRALLDRALKYDYLRQLIVEDPFNPPPTKNAKEVVRAFKKTGLYSEAFLKSLGRGLARSSYFKA